MMHTKNVFYIYIAILVLFVLCSSSGTNRLTKISIIEKKIDSSESSSMVLRLTSLVSVRQNEPIV